eukprot:3427316-Rhodomonas_salina.1
MKCWLGWVSLRTDRWLQRSAFSIQGLRLAAYGAGESLAEITAIGVLTQKALNAVVAATAASTLRRSGTDGSTRYGRAPALVRSIGSAQEESSDGTALAGGGVGAHSGVAFGSAPTLRAVSVVTEQAITLLTSIEKLSRIKVGGHVVGQVADETSEATFKTLTGPSVAHLDHAAAVTDLAGCRRCRARGERAAAVAGGQRRGAPGRAVNARPAA